MYVMGEREGYDDFLVIILLYFFYIFLRIFFLFSFNVFSKLKIICIDG